MIVITFALGSDLWQSLQFLSPLEIETCARNFKFGMNVAPNKRSKKETCLITKVDMVTVTSSQNT